MNETWRYLYHTLFHLAVVVKWSHQQHSTPCKLSWRSVFFSIQTHAKVSHATSSHWAMWRHMAKRKTTDCSADISFTENTFTDTSAKEQIWLEKFQFKQNWRTKRNSWYLPLLKTWYLKWLKKTFSIRTEKVTNKRHYTNKHSLKARHMLGEAGDRS